MNPVLKPIKRAYYRALQKQDILFTNLAVRAMKWRRFSKHPIHPKNLFDPKKGSQLHAMFKPGIAFLDIGAGTGTECLKACEHGASQAVGIEYNPKNIEIALARAAEKNYPVKIIQANLEAAAFPLPDATFDLVNFSNVLEHLNNRVAVLKEIKRVKKPNARVLISVPNANTSWKKKLRSVNLDSRDDEDHKVEYSEEGIRAEIEASGMKIISELEPVIPSFPWNGIFAFSAFFSPEIYRSLQEWKMNYAKKHPRESIGWVFCAE